MNLGNNFKMRVRHTASNVIELLLHPLSFSDRIAASNVKAETLDGTFLSEDHYWLYNRIKPDTTFIDIGSGWGDTSFFFSLNPNVKKLIAYEPIQEHIDISREMLKTYPLKDKIQFVHKAIADSGSVTIKYGNSVERNVESVSLSRAIEGLRNVAIKCDIEGAELYIFPHANLENVYAMEIEYHGCRDEMLDIMKKKGFKTILRESPYLSIYKNRGFIYAYEASAESNQSKI